MTSPALPLAVLFGGPSEEHEISLRSARTVVEHLNPARYEVHLVGITREGGWLGPEASRRLLYGEDPGEAGGPPALPAGTACVFPVLHGPFGEDGRVQGWLELLDVKAASRPPGRRRQQSCCHGPLSAASSAA